MAKLENITVGSTLTGIIGTEPVSVVAIKWFGTTGLEVTYKTSSGKVQNNLLYRDSESSIEIIKQLLPWGFDADGSLLRIVSEAYRIELAHLFDPYLAVHTSAIEPLPHQISAVYEEMLPRQHLRYILADDPGAGKTIMTGLLMKELIVRGDLKRCLIVTPGNLSEQWQDELFRKFNLRFEILTNDRIEAAVTGNIFTEMNFCIARLDKLSRDERLQEKLLASDWDLIVCDEAHKMSASIWAGEIKYTKRFQLGRLLSNITRMFLLLTATPHNGKEEDFQLFMSLIDPDRFEGVARSGQQAVDVSDVLRRLVKEDLLKFDGTPLFPERRAYTVNYSLSPSESALYSAVTEYVQSEFNRAEQLKSDRRNTVGFALTILQRRLASSPEAIYQSLRRRRERLERRLSEEKLEKRAIGFDAKYVVVPDDYDEDDFTAEELEETEDEVSDQASAASTILELEAEIETLKRLEAMANAVRISGEDRKWDELSKLLQDDSRMFASDGEREKLIIFTEHRDTLNYLASRIRSTLGRAEAVELIHGGMLRDERRKVEERFKQDPTVRILIATDAAGEGINLQRAHLMINYDLPWNPNRLEQRFGRIHRIGQTEVCHLWNLVANETREGMVFQRLFQKLEHERSALGGKVFDILGKIKFDDKPLRDLLIEAVRYGNDPDVRARLYQVVDHSMNPEAIRKLLEERALTAETMDIHKVLAIREDMERMEAHKLQPHFIEAFFIAAFQCIGGTIHPREKGRYEIKTVPFAIRNRDMQIGFGTPVLKHYERVCFDKDLCNLPGLPIADLLCPGHPLLEATIDLIRERYNNLLKRGAIFVDEHDETIVPRLLFYIEDTIQDGHILPNGNRRVVSKNVHFIELMQEGTARNAGYAPYLDYRAATSEETAVIQPYIRTQDWLCSEVEDRAAEYAVSTLLPVHFSETKKRIVGRVEKTKKAVEERLTAEIQYWDFRAGELAQKEAAGKANSKLNAAQARSRADELQMRMQKRLAELEEEKQVLSAPPVIVGGALIIPVGLLRQLCGTPAPEFSLGGANKRSVELIAMRTVMELEASLGFKPKDVSAENCGYDIESDIPEDMREKGGPCLRFIEVKGRAKDAPTITVSKNEILTGLNRPDEYILAIVEVDGLETRTTYLKKPFQSAPDFGATSVNYDMMNLIRNAELVFKN